MEKLVSAITMHSIDSRSQSEFGISQAALMEQAATKSWQALVAYCQTNEIEKGRLLCIAGGGNNGGDVLAMARLALIDGWQDITVLLVGNRTTNMCQQQRHICRSLGIPLVEAFSLDDKLSDQAAQIIKNSDILIDGIAGTGLRGIFGGPHAELVAAINQRGDQGAFICSIDIPSGISDGGSLVGVAVKAHLTLSMGLQKIAAYHPLTRPNWAKIVILNPSFPLVLLQQAPAEAMKADFSDFTLAPIPSQAYKYQRGHLGVFAGSSQYPGAGQLAATSAFHSGCGLVTLVCDYQPKVSSSVMLRLLASNEILDQKTIAQSFDALVVGPGWTDHPKAQLLEILHSGLPVVVDATAIKSFGLLVAQGAFDSKKSGPIVLTPHPGELKSLLELLSMSLLAQEVGRTGSVESYRHSLQAISTKLHVVLVLKSNVTWICDGRDETAPLTVVDGSNSALGVAGSGDVLSGIIGSLLCLGLDAQKAALQAVLLHQQAGKVAAKEMGWFDSDMLINYVGLIRP